MRFNAASTSASVVARGVKTRPGAVRNSSPWKVVSMLRWAYSRRGGLDRARRARAGTVPRRRGTPARRGGRGRAAAAAHTHGQCCGGRGARIGHGGSRRRDRKSTRLNSSHGKSSYAVFCLKKKKIKDKRTKDKSIINNISAHRCA